MKKQFPLRAVVLTAMMSAAACVLFLTLEIPLFPAAPFLKLDFSDLPALLAALVYGPAWGVAVELIKNLVHLMFKGVGSQMGFGNIMNFIVGVAFVVPYAAVIRRARRKNGTAGIKALFAAAIAGLICIAAVGLGMNCLIMPLYLHFFLGAPLSFGGNWAIIGFATVLNAVKGVILGAAGVALARLLLRPAAEKFLRDQ